MNEEIVQTPAMAVLAYLGDLESLGMQLEVAMAAIGANALSGFEESLTTQQALCSRLSRFAEQYALGNEGAKPLDPSLAQRLRIASDLMQNLNRRYASLLKHSSESVRQLAGLCRSYAGDSHKMSGSRDNHQSWSCEL
jgi:hypothetical protein